MELFHILFIHFLNYLHTILIKLSFDDILYKGKLLKSQKLNGKKGEKDKKKKMIKRKKNAKIKRKKRKTMKGERKIQG